jgi:Xaa-Pro aminopeptidase
LVCGLVITDMPKPTRQNYSKRLDSLRRRMAAEDLDHILITEPSQVRYLAGFTGSNALLLVGPQRAEFLTDPRYRTQAKSEVKVARVSVVSGDLLDQLPTLDVLKDKRRKIGYESHLISERRAQKLRSVLPLALWVGFDDLVAPLSQVKDPSEIAHIQEAARIADRGLVCVMSLIKPGIRERDIAAELEYQMLMAGSERAAS